MNYFLGNPNGVSIAEIIDCGNSEHFSKLTCSVIPTIEYWKNLDNTILKKIAKKDLKICFEFPVSSIKGAKSSYTDVMLVGKDTNVAIECKWTESLGADCKSQKSKRKDEVQLHWIGIINDYLKTNLTLEDIALVEYQLLHRVASACSLGKTNCYVIYQVFHKDNERNTDFEKEIVKLKNLLGNSKIQFFVDYIEIAETPFYTDFAAELLKMDKQRREGKIKRALSENTFFTFGNDDLKAIL